MEWISVNKKQPKDGQRCLIWFEPRNGSPSATFGWWTVREQSFSVPSAMIDNDLYSVRYWMPEPARPEPSKLLIDVLGNMDTEDEPEKTQFAVDLSGYTDKVSEMFSQDTYVTVKSEGNIVWEHKPQHDVYPLPKKAVVSYNMVERQVLINVLALLEELKVNQHGEESLMAWADEETELIGQTIGDIAYFLENEETKVVVLEISDDWAGVYLNNELIIQGYKEYVYEHALEKFISEIGIGKENFKKIRRSLEWADEHGDGYCPDILEEDELEEESDIEE